MITPDGVLKLIDFGVARTHKRGKSKDTVAMGSAGYAPPEQYGKEQTDERSDVYALGATLLHLLTNMPPIPLQTPARGSIRKINPSVDPQTEQVIIRAMALDVNARYRDAAECEQALHHCLDAPYADPTLRATPPPPIIAPSPPISATIPAARPQPPVPAPQPLPAAPLPLNGATCNRCGRVNKPSARFCAGCGAPLNPPPVARLRITSPRGTWEQKLDHMPVRIGRRDPQQNHYPELDLADHDRGIASRNHAVISRDSDYYTLTDLGSTNGTLINGALVPHRQPQRLNQGDRIKVGEVEMEFRWS
jgi:serine/threonine protein kinase